MENQLSFCLFKDAIVGFIPDYGYNTTTGELEEQSNVCTFEMMNAGDRLIIPEYLISNTSVTVFKWDKNQNYLGYQLIRNVSSNTFGIDYKPESGVYYVAFVLGGTTIHSRPQILDRKVGKYIYPHYKQLKKVNKKEENQAFFRESLSGKLNLQGSNYDYLKNISIETDLEMRIYYNDAFLISASLNKSDCIMNDFRKNAELKLQYSDQYTKILDAFENTYDLIKLAPAITPLTLTKRSVLQLYIQGENTISSYAGGTYWESEVDTPVDDAEQLERRYYFKPGRKFIEINLSGFNYQINATYSAAENTDVWNATCKETIMGQVYEFPCSIKFTKKFNANQYVNPQVVGTVNLLSIGVGDGLQVYSATSARCLYDTYKIEIYTGYNGTGNRIYESSNYYGKDTDKFIISPGNGLYPMIAIEQSGPQMQPTPQSFNLGEFVVEYQIWARLVCDSDNPNLYDLPYDDFALSRNNYKKCIGVSDFGNVITVIQSGNTQEEPTAYGMNDYGEYFTPPLPVDYCYPLAKSSWANTSLWINFINNGVPFENQNKNYYREYELRDCYHLSDVIKALLNVIDPSIKHEKTAEYSSFFYGHSGASAAALGGCDVYITQKTNVLKGEYDQAAQKAEIKFKQLMDMLRDCFRCYWFIDEQNRFRIEHISYFNNGLSYSEPTVQLNLSTKFDKFNKKSLDYDQSTTEFDKAELVSRYEFAYGDKSTKAMGGDLVVNVTNKYVPKNETQEINIDGFAADIDYMLFMPDDFSQDGFVLILADSQKKVPIVHKTVRDEKQTTSDGVRKVHVWTQNWYASFNQLIEHYAYDMSGSSINYNNLDGLSISDIKKCVKQNVKFSLGALSIDLYKLITVDGIKNGYIEEKTESLDTKTTELELRYSPS